VDLGKRTERWLKRTLFGLLFGRRGQVGGSVDLTDVRRVLVVRANFRMGNLLLVTPALAALRRALPQARIDVVAGRAYVDLLEHSPDVDGRIGIDRRMLMAPWSLVSLVRHLRRQRYDVAFDGGRGSSFLGAFLVGVSGSRRRVAAAESRYDALFDVHVPVDPQSLHKIDLLLSLLAGLGIETRERGLSVTLTAEERAQATARWRALGVAPENPAIAVNIGARGAKRWERDRVVELVRALCAEHDRPVVMLVGPEDEEKLREMRPLLPARVMFAPRMAIRAFAAFLSQAAVLVTQDTGPMHLATAVGVPTVALLVAPRSAAFAPRGEYDRTVVGTRATRVPAVLEAVRAALARPHGAMRSADRPHG
jgi:heptosyltransferase-3